MAQDSKTSPDITKDGGADVSREGMEQDKTELERKIDELNAQSDKNNDAHRRGQGGEITKDRG